MSTGAFTSVEVHWMVGWALDRGLWMGRWVGTTGARQALGSAQIAA